MKGKNRQFNNNSLIRLIISLIIRLPCPAFNNGENTQTKGKETENFEQYYKQTRPNRYL